VNHDSTEPNPQQQCAISALSGPILVSAGAGTGKTTVLTRRIQRLIHEHNVNLGQILIVTFTNKAANELLARLSNLVETSGAWIGTFHSLCLRMLRQHHDGIQVIGKDQQYKIISQLNTSKFLQTHDILDAIDTHKNTQQAIKETEVRAIYQRYEATKKRDGLLDYSDLLIRANQLLDDLSIANQYKEQFKFVCIDEYQDTNQIQYEWISKLLNDKQNVFCVGDEDQAIFEWRGSNPNLIKEFDRYFPGAQVLKLEQNYRSTSNILSAANCLIKRNKSRIKKVLQAERGVGSHVYVIEAQDEEHEASLLLQRLQALEGSSAILCRTTGLLRAFESALKAQGSGYNVLGTASFYQRSEIKDIRAYARFLINPDDFEAFCHIANLPRRGLGPKTAEQIKVKIDASGGTTGTLEIVARQHPLLQEFFIAIDLARKKSDRTDGLRYLLDTIGYTKLRQLDPSGGASQKRENIDMMLARAAEAKSDAEFLRIFEQTETVAEEKPQISLMTIHSAKGLEFDNVALPGWEEGVLPHGMSVAEGKVEEERRLAYVAITRARNNLFISYACKRYRSERGKRSTTVPSRFLTELPLSVKWVMHP
jgi:DNA helicase-2/ATP-dependent DNA helicase PcrA